MFETGSYFASRAEHIDSMMAAAWMPLAWLAVWQTGVPSPTIRIRCKLRVDWLAVLAAALGLSVWGGFPQATVAVFGSTVMFAGLLAHPAYGTRPTYLLWACCGCALGILLAAVPFIPTTQLTELSVAKYRVGLAGHRRRTLLAEPGLVGRAQPLQHIRHQPFQWPRRPDLSLSLQQHRRIAAGDFRARSAPQSDHCIVRTPAGVRHVLDAGR